jgi:hypothetical protein
MKHLRRFNESTNTNLEEITPGRFVYHLSAPVYRDQIERIGLLPKRGEQWLTNTPIEGEAIFATDSDNEEDWYDSSYDDDVYEIDTDKISNKWYVDPNFQVQDYSKHIVTFDKIPPSAISLIHRGTGDSKY